MSDPSDLCWLDAHEQAALVERGEVRPEELVASAVARIAEVDPALNALCDLDVEWALHRAERARGPWRGVPTLLKDVIAYPGFRWSMGSRAFQSQRADHGSAYTDSLDLLGLVVLGKTTTSEWGLLASTECLLHGPTRNPWDLARSALGSSGGAAVAVASGMVPVAHGADGGGSLRLPASATGVFGFKPSSRTVEASGPDLGPLDDLVVHHVLTRSVRDSARVFAATEAALSPWPGVGWVASSEPRPRLKIGAYAETATGDVVDDEVLRALEAAKQLCRDLGHEVVEVPPPDVSPEDVAFVFFAYAAASVSPAYSAVSNTTSARLGRAPGAESFEPYTLSLLEWFWTQGPGWAEKARVARERVDEAMRTFLGRVDVTLSPTMPFLPPPLGTVSPLARFDPVDFSYGMRLAGFTAVHNVAGAPAMSVPLFVASCGLPVGVMFAAPPGDDRRLWRLAYELEEARPWRDRRPPRVDVTG